MSVRMGMVGRMASSVYRKVAPYVPMTAKPGSRVDRALNKVLRTDNVLDRLDCLKLNQALKTIVLPEIQIDFPIFGVTELDGMPDVILGPQPNLQLGKSGQPLRWNTSLSFGPLKNPNQRGRLPLQRGTSVNKALTPNYVEMVTGPNTRMATQGRGLGSLHLR